MSEAPSKKEETCRGADVAAYLDGELDAAASRRFEAHARVCSSCAAALNEQKRLLCLLDVAFDKRSGGELRLPTDFARVVTARARTDMSGVRASVERRRALAALRALRVFGHALSEAASGLAAILRTASGGLDAGPPVNKFLTWALFACALLLLLRLIGRYRREREDY